MIARTTDNDYNGDTTRPRTAGLLVEVFPIGKPGVVGLAIHNIGPEPLSQDEAVRVLANAVLQLNESATWRG